MPSFLQACSHSSAPPVSRQLMLVQTWMWYLPERLAVQHRVVGDHLVHLQRRDAGALGDFLDQLRRDATRSRPARTAASGPRADRCAPGGIALQQLLELRFQFWRKSHLPIRYPPARNPCCPWPRSTSAISRPSTICGSACRLPKLGRAHEHAVRLRRAIADHVVAQSRRAAIRSPGTPRPPARGSPRSRS